MSPGQSEIDFFDPGFTPRPFLSRIVPENIAREFNIAPLAFQDSAILIASDGTLSQGRIDSLEEIIRRPVRIVILTRTQVKRYRGKLYTAADLRPASPPLKPLLDKLAISYESLPLSSISDEIILADVNLSEWLTRGWINESQWGQLMGFHFYLPYKTTLSPSPLNALPKFLSRENRHYLTKEAFVPLWWARNSLYIGVSDFLQMDAVKQMIADWELDFTVLLIPPTVKSDLKSDVAKRNLFSSEVDERQIAKSLLDQNQISPQSLNAAKTLKKTTGVPIANTLLSKHPKLADDWLEAKASLMDTYAVYERDLPRNFEEQLLTFFHRVPYPLCRLLQVLPLNYVESTLIVGMDEIHPGVIEILSQLSRSEVEARLMRPDIINKWLNLSGEKNNLTKKFSAGVSDIRELILAAELIQPDQLRRSESKDASDVQDYLNHLLSEDLLDEADITELLAILHHLPPLSLEGFQFDSDLIAEFSQSFLNENHLLPLAQFEDDLWVSLADPHDDQHLETLEENSGLTIWPLVVPRTSLEVAINRYVNVLSMKESTQYLSASINYLIENEVVSEEHRQDIIRDVVQKGQLFDRVIEKYRKSEEKDLFRLFSEFRDVPLVSLTPVEDVREVVDPLGNQIKQTQTQDPVDGALARRLDYETARRLRALPVDSRNGGIQVAFATPLYDQALRSLERLLQTEVYPCITPREELENAIDRVLGRTNIGSLLLNAGLITRGQLNDALSLAENTSSRIGQALIHRGYITEDELYSFLSKQSNLPLFDLSYVNLNKEVTEILTPDEEWEHGVLPLSRDADTVVVGVIDPINRDPIKFIEEKTGLNIRPVLITENDFENALERLHSEHYTAQSVSALLSREPENSAARVLTSSQIIVLIILVLASIGLAIWNLQNFLIGVNAIFTIIYIMMIFYKFVLIANAIGTDLEVPVSEEDIEDLQDDQLPIYTILIPVYKEASILPKLLKSITRLDYPKIKLDVKVLLEEDDEETIAAFEEIKSLDYIQGLVIPTSHPKTKPKACNYGLIRARGEYVVIYDAEDQPEPDQLKKVIAAFQKIPPNVICIQSKLNYFNRRQNLLTQWFSSEYSMWFDLFLPGLDARKAPIPLGGTSNHFKKFALVEAGAWDPHNVTEDADLGIRLYKLGYRTRIVDTTTYEEANSQVNNWIRQRSRWVKGYIQTWLVHMRHPIQLIREIGFMAFFSFQMVVGGNFFTVLINPIYWLTTTIWFIFGIDFIGSLFPGIIYILGAISLFFGNFTFTYINVAGAMKRGYFDMVRTALISPLYWGLMSIAGWKGFLQLITNPHYWEKTEHGLEGVEDGSEGEVQS